MAFALSTAACAILQTIHFDEGEGPSGTEGSPVSRPAPSPSSTITDTVDLNPTTSAMDDALYKGEILLSYGFGENSDLFVIGPPYETASPMASDDSHYYGHQIWSQDGTKVAFSKNAVGCPNPDSSVWVADVCHGSMHQVTISIEGVINQQTGDCDLTNMYPAAPIYWLSDNDTLVVSLKDKLHLVSSSSRSISPLEIASYRSLFINGNPSAESIGRLEYAGNQISPDNRTLIGSFMDGEAHFLGWINLKDRISSKILHSPDDFSYNDFGYAGLSHSWSPSSRYIVLPERNEDEARLWLVDVDEDIWRVVARLPLKDIQGTPSIVSWSPDGKWVAWATWAYDDVSAVYNPQIRIFDTSTWQQANLIPLSDLLPFADFEQWVTVEDGSSWLAVSQLAPGGGIFLIDPINVGSKELLVSFEVLNSPAKRLSVIGPFQPLP